MGSTISVIIPVHNGERYLAEAIKSVVDQTCPASEIIVVDDGSTDRSGEIARGFGPSIRYVHQANAGTAAARNRGVTLSRGEHLAFLDQDDVWALDKLARQMDAFEENAALDAVFGRIRQFYTPDCALPNRPALHGPEGTVDGYLPSAMVVRREAFLRVGAFDPHWEIAAWADWYIRAREAGLTVHVVPCLVAWRRLHPDNHGRTARTRAREYAQVLKASLDRRRAAGGHAAS